MRITGLGGGHRLAGERHEDGVVEAHGHGSVPPGGEPCTGTGGQEPALLVGGPDRHRLFRLLRGSHASNRTGLYLPFVHEPPEELLKAR